MKFNRRETIKALVYGSAGLSLSSINSILANSPQTFGSQYHRIEINDKYPEFRYFSIDSLGKNKLGNNPLIISGEKKGPDFISKQSGEIARYYLSDLLLPAWEFESTQNGFILRSNYVKDNVPWTLKFNQNKNHVTVLGLIKKKESVDLPALMHLPDMGSLRVRSQQTKTIEYKASREDFNNKYVEISFPAATSSIPFVEYRFEVVAIYPEIDNIETNPLFDGYRRNYLNTFQLNPNWMLLSNNTTSDSCAFVQYGYSELAVHAPNLIDNLTAIDLVKMTLERFLDGQKAYGMFGYYADIPGTENVQWGGQNASLDTYPSLLISGCNCCRDNKNKDWLVKNFSGLKVWAEEILSRDKDGDGIIEYGYSGNSGSWTGEPTQRPANWWDTIGFGHKDAYSNALAYSALVRFSKLCQWVEDERAYHRYREFAAKLKRNYYETFFNPETGVLAGWKSEDGQLHDYYFTFVNGIAVAYDLVSEEQGNQIMNALLAKIYDLGYNNFENGMPGNLVSIKREDYTHHDPRWGGHTSDEANDGWMHYENGGISGNFVYFTISALFKLGRRKDAERILIPLLKGFEKGNFQGKCDNGMTKDWKTWDGECWGYEGFLVDNYWGLLAVVENY